MNENNINEWVGQAKAHENENVAAPSSGVKVIRKEVPKNRGMVIIEIAEKLRPVFQNFFKDRRDVDGMLFQPAHIRGFALNYAEYLVKAKEQDNNAAA